MVYRCECEYACFFAASVVIVVSCCAADLTCYIVVQTIVSWLCFGVMGFAIAKEPRLQKIHPHNYIGAIFASLFAVLLVVFELTAGLTKPLFFLRAFLDVT